VGQKSTLHSAETMLEFRNRGGASRYRLRTSLKQLVMNSLHSSSHYALGCYIENLQGGKNICNVHYCSWH
jgi:hypothetical protein